MPLAFRESQHGSSTLNTNKDGAALRYVDEALRGDREFVLNALQRNAEVRVSGLPNASLEFREQL